MVSKADIDLYLRNFSLSEDSSNISMFETDKSRTEVSPIELNGVVLNKYTNEFWTHRQRQACSIHEISYRACFKPQLPRFFIQLLSKEDSVVYDPFSGRGTTVLEAGLLGRRIISNDANPLSSMLVRPRFTPPQLSEVQKRLAEIPTDSSVYSDIDLSMFFHKQTLSEILSLRRYLLERRKRNKEDDVDRWIAMVATNRLTGHSTGFFSVYTLPPNQAVSPERQIKINKARNQIPQYRNVRDIISTKTKSLLRSISKEQQFNLSRAANSALFICGDARSTPQIKSGEVQLVVTSPPFLDVVQYAKDNWLRLWFNSIDPNESGVPITMARSVKGWTEVMEAVFIELHRVCKSSGWVAFEVGEIKNRTINLDEHVVPIGISAGFECVGILVNSQEFSKTSNIWGVKNMKSGTNTNRIVLFRKN